MCISTVPSGFRRRRSKRPLNSGNSSVIGLLVGSKVLDTFRRYSEEKAKNVTGVGSMGGHSHPQPRSSSIEDLVFCGRRLAASMTALGQLPPRRLAERAAAVPPKAAAPTVRRRGSSTQQERCVNRTHCFRAFISSDVRGCHYKKGANYRLKEMPRWGRIVKLSVVALMIAGGTAMAFPNWSNNDFYSGPSSGSLSATLISTDIASASFGFNLMPDDSFGPPTTSFQNS